MAKQERNGAAHRIMTTNTQDPASHYQTTQANSPASTADLHRVAKSLRKKGRSDLAYKFLQRELPAAQERETQ